MRDIVVIAHDIRSSHNVGSLLRTCEGLGVKQVYFTGYTPYPAASDDTRLPHLAQKINRQIAKTALGAEQLIRWQHVASIENLVAELHRAGYELVALEQAAEAVPLPDYRPPRKLALLLGREVAGIDEQLLERCDKILEIPMLGKKESFNVVQAASMALYHCRFVSP